jgi:hypothetical protein
MLDLSPIHGIGIGVTAPKEVFLVGAVRFERTTLCSQSRCATRLRHAPTFLHFISDLRHHHANAAREPGLESDEMVAALIKSADVMVERLAGGGLTRFASTWQHRH